MNYAENARHLISRDELHDAFALLKMSIEDNEQRNSIILLESHHQTGKTGLKKTSQLSLAERNRITFSILAIISEIEAQKRPTIKQQQQQVLETLLEKSFEKITELEKPANMTDEALAKLEKASPDHLEQLKNLSVAFLASKNEHGDTWN
ncbi:MAG: hypothetical protein IPL27_01155 [Lewinellaceae bacterium]|nr:hypothetical protein [Lewinellaceae bacterium]